MRDRRKSYNRPLIMKRSEMGYIYVESSKRKGGPTRAPAKAGFCLTRVKGSRAIKVEVGDHNLGQDGRSGRPVRNRSPRS
jgi:hypothetical protein